MNESGGHFTARERQLKRRNIQVIATRVLLNLTAGESRMKRRNIHMKVISIDHQY